MKLLYILVFCILFTLIIPAYGQAQELSSYIITDKQSYYKGETILISGTSPENEENTEIIIVIKDSDNRIDSILYSIINSDRTFNANHTITTKNIGNYTVYAGFDRETIQTTFELLPNTIYLTTNKPSYNESEIITAKGTVSHYIEPSADISIKYFDEIISSKKIAVNSDRSYSAELELGGYKMIKDGSYTIQIDYDGATAQTKINYWNHIPLEISKENHYQENISVSALLNTETYNEVVGNPVIVNVYNPNGTKIIPEETGFLFPTGRSEEPGVIAHNIITTKTGFENYDGDVLIAVQLGNYTSSILTHYSDYPQELTLQSLYSMMYGIMESIPEPIEYPEPVIVPVLEPIQLTASIDKNIYNFGETLRLTGNIGNSTNHNLVGISVYEGNNLTYLTTIPTQSDGSFEKSIDFKSILSNTELPWGEGLYNLTTLHGEESLSLEFIILPILYPPLELTTDKKNYYLLDPVTLTGTLHGITGSIGDGVKITILDKNQHIILEEIIPLMSSTYFTITVIPDDPIWREYSGEITIRAQYEEYIAETQITYADHPELSLELLYYMILELSTLSIQMDMIQPDRIQMDRVEVKMCDPDLEENIQQTQMYIDTAISDLEEAVSNGNSKVTTYQDQIDELSIELENYNLELAMC